MSHARRTSDRRRRVLYSAHQADHAQNTAASRREASRLREARSPQAAYGSRVHRRIRGRWFSLVPIQLRTMILVTGLLGLMTSLLTAAHYASVAWPAIAYRPEIARPLRLDRPDSFGRWYMIAMLVTLAGVSLMIYQLRRYRNDDFQGRYRLWRLVLVVMMLASINALVSIIDWGGALLDAGFGKRVALTGSDWIRLIVSLGGVILALRLIAEVRRCRAAVVMMILACLLFAIPESAKWNVMEVDSISSWTLATSAPLLGCTALLIALGSYLRMLYREVKEIGENDSIRNRFETMRLRLFKRPEQCNDEAEPVSEHSRRWWQRKPEEKPQTNANDSQDQRETVSEEKPKSENPSPDTKDMSPRGKRRWFGLRKAEVKPETTPASKQSKKEKENPAKPAKKKRRRFSMRLSPPLEANQEESSDEEPRNAPQPDNEEPTPSDTKSKRGLGWLRRKKSSDPQKSAKSSQQPQQEPSRETPDSEHESPESDSINPDDIDWSTMSKAERRRIRKQLKRQNRAA